MLASYATFPRKGFEEGLLVLAEPLELLAGVDTLHDED